MTSNEPNQADGDPFKGFAERMKKASEQMQAGLQQAGFVLSAQGAMGWAYKGDLAQARRVLEKLPPEKLTELSMAAAALSSLADEVAAAKS